MGRKRDPFPFERIITAEKRAGRFEGIDGVHQFIDRDCFWFCRHRLVTSRVEPPCGTFLVETFRLAAFRHGRQGPGLSCRRSLSPSSNSTASLGHGREESSVPSPGPFVTPSSTRNLKSHRRNGDPLLRSRRRQGLWRASRMTDCLCRQACRGPRENLQAANRGLEEDAAMEV